MSCFQFLHWLLPFILHTLEQLNIPLIVSGPKLSTVFKNSKGQLVVTLCPCRPDAVGLLGHLNTLLACVQLDFYHHSKLLFCQANFQSQFPKPLPLHRIVMTQVEYLILRLVEWLSIGLDP